MDGGGRRRIARRRRRDRAGSALPLEAVVAALQPVGDARPGGRQTGRRARRLLPARQGQAQVGLTAAQRRKNVAGAFRLTAAKGALREKRIVVVDDVITTGATAEEPSALLL